MLLKSQHYVELVFGINADYKSIGDFYIGLYDYYRVMYRMGTMKTPIITIMNGLTGIGIFL